MFSPEPDGARKSNDSLAAHHPRLGLDPHRVDPAALEDPLVRAPVRLERDVEAFLVAIERVRVLHDELADAEQSPTRARLVALLHREVVEDLRELAVALELARVECECLLVRQREDEVAAVPILEAKDLLDVVTAALLPELERRQHRAEHLLAADRVDLLAHDLHDLLVHGPPQREVRPDPGADLADVAPANEQLVRDGLGVGRCVAQCRDEEGGLTLEHGIPRLVDARSPRVPNVVRRGAALPPRVRS